MKTVIVVMMNLPPTVVTTVQKFVNTLLAANRPGSRQTLWGCDPGGGGSDLTALGSWNVGELSLDFGLGRREVRCGGVENCVLGSALTSLLGWT